MYNITETIKTWLNVLLMLLRRLPQGYTTKGMQNLLDAQVSFYEKFYSWKNRQHEWTNFLTGVLNDRKS
jgi:hypothetical protein